MFEEFRRIESLIEKSNKKLEMLSRESNGSCKEAFYRRKANEAFKCLTVLDARSQQIQPYLSLVAYYLLLANSEEKAL